MKTTEFCYWLQGYFELSETVTLSDKQVEVIKNHLNLVFIHDIDPKTEKESNASKEELDNAHNPFIGRPENARC